MNLNEFVAIYRPDNLRHSKCTNPHHDEYGHICEELIELKAELNSGNKLKIAEELADVVIMAAIYAGKLNIDLAFALEFKTTKNFRDGRLGSLTVAPTTTPPLPKFDEKSEAK